MEFVCFQFGELCFLLQGNRINLCSISTIWHQIITFSLILRLSWRQIQDWSFLAQTDHPNSLHPLCFKTSLSPVSSVTTIIVTYSSSHSMASFSQHELTKIIEKAIAAALDDNSRKIETLVRNGICKGLMDYEVSWRGALVFGSIVSLTIYAGTKTLQFGSYSSPTNHTSWILY